MTSTAVALPSIPIRDIDADEFEQLVLQPASSSMSASFSSTYDSLQQRSRRILSQQQHHDENDADEHQQEQQNQNESNNSNSSDNNNPFAPDTLFVVFIGALWLGPVRLLFSTWLPALAAQHAPSPCSCSPVQFLKLDWDANDSIALDQLNVTSLPTTIAFRNTLELGRVVGLSREKINALIETHK